MRIAFSFFILLLLSGCGAFGGGSSYHVEYSLPDGTTVKAYADSVESTKSILFSLSRDAEGRPTISFSKEGVSPGEWQNSAVDRALGIAEAALGARR